MRLHKRVSFCIVQIHQLFPKKDRNIIRLLLLYGINRRHLSQEIEHLLIKFLRHNDFVALISILSSFSSWKACNLKDRTQEKLVFPFPDLLDLTILGKIGFQATRHLPHTNSLAFWTQSITKLGHKDLRVGLDQRKVNIR